MYKKLVLSILLVLSLCACTYKSNNNGIKISEQSSSVSKISEQSSSESKISAQNNNGIKLTSQNEISLPSKDITALHIINNKLFYCISEQIPKFDAADYVYYTYDLSSKATEKIGVIERVNASLDEYAYLDNRYIFTDDLVVRESFAGNVFSKIDLQNKKVTIINKTTDFVSSTLIKIAKIDDESFLFQKARNENNIYYSEIFKYDLLTNQITKTAFSSMTDRNSDNKLFRSKVACSEGKIYIFSTKVSNGSTTSFIDVFNSSGDLIDTLKLPQELNLTDAPMINFSVNNNYFYFCSTKKAILLRYSKGNFEKPFPELFSSGKAIFFTFNDWSNDQMYFLGSKRELYLFSFKSGILKLIPVIFDKDFNYISNVTADKDGNIVIGVLNSNDESSYPPPESKYYYVKNTEVEKVSIAQSTNK